MTLGPNRSWRRLNLGRLLLADGAFSSARERDYMLTDSTHVMPWRIEDIDLSRIDRRKAASNEHLLLLLCACSFIESGTDLYTSNLSKYFHDDPEISAWLNNEWEPEEMQHGRALRT